MRKVLIGMFSSALMLGVAVAQDSATPPPASPPSEPQTSAPAQPSTQQATPEPAAQPAQTQAPQPGASSNPAGAPARIAPGSVLPVSLTKTIDAKKAKTGDEVVAKVTQDMKNSAGEVIVAKDTKVVGHVTEAQARTKEQKESEVGIAFDRAVMKNGSEMQMPMSIQAIIGPQDNSQQNSQNNAGGGTGYGSAPGGTTSNSNTGRAGGMAGSAPSSTPSPSAGASAPGDAQQAPSARPPITAQTKGVVGISDLKLTSTAPAANQGSVVSSDKNSVKLESGTLMLLRVNQ
jgi:hypothetical protein